jgi:hypothetical protein
MDFKTQIRIDRPASVAWKVVGESSAHIDEWASAVDSSSMANGPALAATRTYKTAGVGPFKLGQVREVVTKFNPDARMLEFWAIEGLPGFFRQAVHGWAVHEVDAGHSIVEMHASVKIGGLMRLLGPLFRRMFKSSSARSLKELKYFVEHDTPHPRKRLALAVAGLPADRRPPKNAIHPGGRPI